MTTYAAVPDLPDKIRLQLVQQEIQQFQIEHFKMTAAIVALPVKDPQLPQLSEQAKRAEAILAGYRVQEAELLARLNDERPADP